MSTEFPVEQNFFLDPSQKMSLRDVGLEASSYRRGLSAFRNPLWKKDFPYNDQFESYREEALSRSKPRSALRFRDAAVLEEVASLTSLYYYRRDGSQPNAYTPSPVKTRTDTHQSRNLVPALLLALAYEHTAVVSWKSVFY